MSHHPKDEMLRAYAEGELQAVDGFVVATHVESCPACRKKCIQFEMSAAEAFVSAPVSGDFNMSAMFDKIVALEEAPEPFEFNRKARVVSVNGKNFTLPLSLSRFTEQIGEWKNYGGKVFSAEVAIGEEARINLLYIAEGVQIPQHTHKGLESTLVLHGGFSDEDGHYEAGDYLLRDASIKHSPYTLAGEDCLCLTVLTQPLLFTQGVARVFNLFGKGLYP